MKNTIYIIRHGESENNVLGIESTDMKNKDKFGLSKLGKQETREKANYHISFDVIYTSPFRRAKETADFFSNTSKCELEENSLLREVFIGDLEECTSNELNMFFQNQKGTGQFSTNGNVVGEKIFMGGNTNDIVFPNGESLNSADERIIKAYNQINQDNLGNNILIVTHGGLIKALLLHIGGKKLVSEYKEGAESSRDMFKIQ